MQYLSLKVPGSDQPIAAPPGIPTLDKANSLGNIVTWAISLAVAVGVLLALAFLLYGGYLWITSRGDKQKLDAARKTVIYAIVGLIIVVLALAAITVAQQLLGVEFFKIGGSQLPKCDSVPPGQFCIP